jgi:hypothetical protein
VGKRLIDVLRTLAREMVDKGYDADDALKAINIFDIDFPTIKDELLTMELTRHIDESELDTIRALLAFILMKDTDLETEEIYAFIFGRGRQIIWN